MHQIKLYRYGVLFLTFMALISCDHPPSPTAPATEKSTQPTHQQGQTVGGAIKASPTEPVSSGGRVLTPEEYKAREKMLEGTHLPGPMPPPESDSPAPVGPAKGTDTMP